MVREHDSLRCKELAKRLAGIIDANIRQSRRTA